MKEMYGVDAMGETAENWQSVIIFRGGPRFVCF
jgi:hypothetical protein